MTGKEYRVAAKFKTLPQWENMLKVNCICYRLTLVCADAGDDLQFIQDFETTMIQLWAFLKNLLKSLKITLKQQFKLNNFKICKKTKKRK